MTTGDNILNELKELESTLATVSVTSSYTVPARYFDGLAMEILARAKALDAADARGETAELSSILSSAGNNPYHVPVGYFEQLPAALLQRVQNDAAEEDPAEELATISPLLSGLKKQTPYSVPAGYFDTVSIPVEKPAEKAKIISLTSRKWFRYAAAALVIGFVASLGFLFLGKKDAPDPSEKSFAWVEMSMKKVSTDEIDAFVEMTDRMAPVIAGNNEKNDIQELIKNIPDKDIQDFLNDAKAAEADDDIADDAIFN